MPSSVMLHTHTLNATAPHDLQDLAENNILIPTRGGRSTHYKVNL